MFYQTLMRLSSDSTGNGSLSITHVKVFKAETAVQPEEIWTPTLLELHLLEKNYLAKNPGTVGGRRD